MFNAGTLYVVATPIGNLKDITQRARDTLAQVAEVWAEDTRHSKKLFQHLGIAPRVVACHDHNESTRVETLLTRLREGDSIALISDAGTPLISDPGYRLVSACREKGFSVCPIPGASAVVAALSVSGLPTDRFVFEGFPPSKTGARNEFFCGLRNESRTMIFYESSHRIKASLAAMCEHFGVDRPSTVARELTKMHETVVAGSLAELLENVSNHTSMQKGEFVVLVGGAEVAGDDDDLSLELNRVLQLLLPEMSLKRASVVAAEITGAAKNQAYRAALALNH